MFPFLSRLDKKYKDKVSVATVLFQWWGKDLPSDEQAIKVTQDSVAGEGSKVTYSFAADKLRGDRTETLWLKASNPGELGVIYIIDQQGKLAYIGHDGFAEFALEHVLNGTFDADAKSKLAAMQQKSQKLYDEIEKANKANNAKEMLRLFGEILSMPYGKYSNAQPMTRFNYARNVDAKLAYDYAYHILKNDLKDDAHFLLDIANSIKNPWPGQEPDIDLALAMAKRSSELDAVSYEKIGARMTVAECYALKGDFKEAVIWVQKAKEIAQKEYPEDSYKATMMKSYDDKIALYKEGKLK
jgi:tetratricopeptide (TPR) repeat protein